MNHLRIINKYDLLNQESGLVNAEVDGTKQYLHLRKVDMHLSSIHINSICNAIDNTIVVSMDDNFTDSITLDCGNYNSSNEQVYYIFLPNDESILIAIDGNKISASYGHINYRDFVIISIGNEINVYEK